MKTPPLNLLSLLDGSLSEQERVLLLDRVAQEPCLVDELVRLAVVDDLLRQQADHTRSVSHVDWAQSPTGRPDIGDSVESKGTSVSRSGTLGRPRPEIIRRTIAATATAAVACVLLFAAAYATRPIGDRGLNQPNAANALKAVAPPAFAAVSRSANVQWTIDAPRWSVGERLRMGDVVRLDSGRVELTFDSGTILALAGPAELELRSPDLAMLGQGTATTRVSPSQANQFRILTPTSEVLDLGTEFGVRVNARGETDVAVFEGAIDVTSTSVAEYASRRLEAGEAARVRHSGTYERILSIESDDFPFGDKLYPRRSLRRPVILSVDDDRRDPASQKFYQIYPESLQEDARAYVDRIYEWNGIDANGIPGILLGADYIATFNDDKYGAPLITVELSGPATVFVFYDDRLEVPDWLISSYEDTGLKIGLDGGRTENGATILGKGPGVSVDRAFSVWRRDIDRPGPLQLGQLGVRRETEYGEAMFGIAAQPR